MILLRRLTYSTPGRYLQLCLLLLFLCVQNSSMHLHLGPSLHHHDGDHHHHAHDRFSNSGIEHQQKTAELEFTQNLLVQQVAIDLMPVFLALFVLLVQPRIGSTVLRPALCRYRLSIYFAQPPPSRGPPQ